MIKTGSESLIRQNIYFQVFFWTALFLFGTAKSYGEYDGGNFGVLVIYNFCHWIFQIIGANLIYYILICHFSDRKKYIDFFLFLITGLYLLSVINRVFIVYIAEPFFISEPKDSLISIFTDIRYLTLHYTLPVVSGSFIFISIQFIMRYRDEKENSLKLQKEKAELELKSLKSQLNPHFLFNTLNNIYSLSISNSDKTSQSISQLSDILDYILYKAEKKWVAISEELTIIEQYMALEHLRYNHERLKIGRRTMLHSSNTIPPLLYLTLVENTFKHGAGKNTGITEISIEIEADDKQTYFSIENTCPDHQDNNENGIGLQNIKRQLEHHYQNNFVFRISRKNNTFKVEIITPPQYD